MEEENDEDQMPQGWGTRRSQRLSFDLQFIFSTDKTNVTGDRQDSIKLFSSLVTFDKCKTIIQIGGAIFNNSNNILQGFFPLAVKYLGKQKGTMTTQLEKSISCFDDTHERPALS